MRTFFYQYILCAAFMSFIIFSGCDSSSVLIPPSASVPVVANNTDMTLIASDGTASLIANNSIVQALSPTVFLMNSGTGATVGSSQLGPNPNIRLGGKAFLGFPEYDGAVITTSSFIQFTRNTAVGAAAMYFNLIVDSGCDGVFGAGDAIVGFSSGTSLNVRLDQNSTVIGVYKGTISGIVANVSKLAQLSGMCIINADTQDNGMPWGKKMAGVLVVVGDSSGALNNRSFQISNLTRQF